MTVRIPGTQIKLNGKATIGLGSLLVAVSGVLASYAWAQIVRVPGLVEWKSNHTEFAEKNLAAIRESFSSVAETQQTKNENDREWRAAQNQWNKLLYEEVRDTRRETNAKLDRLIEKMP